MKVKEIVEILNEKGQNVTTERIVQMLDNIGTENADAETDVEDAIVKKFGKLFKVDIKPIKAKKSTKQDNEINKRSEGENQSEGKFKANLDEKNSTPKTKEQKIAPKDSEKQYNENNTKNNQKQEVKNNNNLDTKKVKENEQKSASKPQSQNQDQKAQNSNPKNSNNQSFNSKKHTDVYNEEDETNKELEKLGQYEDKYSDFSQDNKQYSRIKNVKKKQNNKQTKDRTANVPIEKKQDEKIIYYTEGMTVAKVADALGRGIGEIVKKLVMLGYFANASDVLERDVVELIVEDCGYELKNEINSDITKFEEMDIEDDPKDLVERPAIVTIMGHVDHGKTTLLDTIRHSRVTAGEAGGITQHIGAYQVKKNGKLITFIDTPGHAAFTEMRARGANITDIVILVVAADDGVMPQTKEAIEHSKAAGVPIIVAVNKMDKPTANPDRVKQELAQYDLLAEDWGGKTIFVPISALKGDGVDELLEMVTLVAEMNEYKANPNRLAIGTVLEAKLDKGKGVVATLLVKNGSLKVGDPIVVGNTWGKIRSMTDETKSIVKVASPSKAVEVSGLVDVPNAGDRFMVFSDEKTARLICEERINRKANEELAKNTVSLASLFNNDDSKELNLLIKGDVQGSLEALQGSLSKLDVEGVKVNVVRSAVGAITETDISLAIVSKAIIIAFNVRSSSKIIDLAKEKGIEVRYYDIIYKLLEDIEAAMKGLLDPVYEEKVIGEAIVRQTYKVSKVGTIAGCYVTNGVIERGSNVRLIRNSIVVYTGKLSSLKRFKDDVKEVTTGFECGITIENYNDIKEDDVIEVFKMDEVKNAL